MSFLNPVSEPVLRFNSTDAGAPQIKYNARVAGDVKEVLKACLVTGYGATASAGWSIVNEVSHVAEFVSPSVAMSDYRLGIDDTSAASTTWYYQYQDVRVNPSRNIAIRAMDHVDKNSSLNGWQLIVTERGIYFVEILRMPAINALTSRITYWGSVKSALLVSGDKNMGFWALGLDAPFRYTSELFTPSLFAETHYDLQKKPSAFAATNLSYLASTTDFSSTSTNDLFSGLYLVANNQFIAQQAGLLLRTPAQPVEALGVYDGALNDRPILNITIGATSSNDSIVRGYSRQVAIYLDYWEY